MKERQTQTTDVSRRFIRAPNNLRCRRPKPLATKRIRFYSVMSRTTHIIRHSRRAHRASVNHVCKVKNAHGNQHVALDKDKKKKESRSESVQKLNENTTELKFYWWRVPHIFCIHYPCCVVLSDILVWREFIYFHFPSVFALHFCIVRVHLFLTRPFCGLDKIIKVLISRVGKIEDDDETRREIWWASSRCHNHTAKGATERK